MEWLRLAYRLTAFSLCLTATALLAIGLTMQETLTRRPIDRTLWARRCFRWACQCLGLAIHCHGVRPEANALFASNHISWSDIPVLGGLAPMRFLSKAEVAQWPAIGWLARQAGTLFIKRGGGQARRVRAAMIETLRTGDSVLIFPEGTTSNGLTVLPFHGRLLAAAAESGVPVQPVTICYRRHGRPDHLAPFVGEDAFHRHLLTMLRQPPARVDVLFHPALEIDGKSSSAELSALLRLTVQAGLARIQAGELDRNRSGNLRTAGGPEPSPLQSLPGDR